MAQPDPEVDGAAGLEESILLERAESLAMAQNDHADGARTGILLFALGEEWYGVNISSVREIYNEYVVTPVPCVPHFVAGVVNIRGEIVSVTDLRAMMGLEESERQVGEEQAPVIVVSDDTISTALVVDAVGDIVDVDAESIEPPLAITDKAQADYISGTFYAEGQLAALVNLSRVLAPVVSG